MIVLAAITRSSILYNSLLLLVLIITGLAAYLLAIRAYGNLVRDRNPYARELTVVTFVVSFLLIFVTVSLIILKTLGTQG